MDSFMLILMIPETGQENDGKKRAFPGIRILSVQMENA